MFLTLDDGGPFIFIGVDEIVHESVEFATNTEFIIKDDFSKFLRGMNKYDEARREILFTSIPPSMFSIHRAVRCSRSAVMM